MLVTPEGGSHWYTRDGKPCHEVPMKTKPGEMRAVKLPDAIKLDLLPSVTNYLGVVAKPALIAYLQTQAIMASLTLPRLDGESLDDFARRVVTDMRAHPKDARDIGIKIHADCEEWANGTHLGMSPHVDGFARWLDKETDGVIWTEKTLVGEDYAGTADLLVMHKEHGELLVDLKTQDVKKDKPAFYDEWCWQNAAYAACIDKPRIGNLIIDKTEPGRVFFKLWERVDQDDGLIAFNAAKTIWQIQKKYRPRILA